MSVPQFVRRDGLPGTAGVLLPRAICLLPRAATAPCNAFVVRCGFPKARELPEPRWLPNTPCEAFDCESAMRVREDSGSAESSEACAFFVF